MTIAVITLQDYAADLSAGSGNIEKAFNGETVIAMKGLIRAAFPLTYDLKMPLNEGQSRGKRNTQATSATCIRFARAAFLSSA